VLPSVAEYTLGAGDVVRISVYQNRFFWVSCG
jgi:protein involved in polysaccharide export with SLBB domain